MVAVGDNIMGNMQTQACALPGCFCGKERLEDTRLNIGWNSGSIIRDLNNDMLIFLGCFDSDLTFAMHRVHGVVDDVRPYLVELAGIRFDAGHICRIFPFDRHALFQFMLHDDQCILQSVVDIHFEQGRLIKVRVGLYRVDDLRNPLGRLQHLR